MEFNSVKYYLNLFRFDIFIVRCLGVTFSGHSVDRGPSCEKRFGKASTVIDKSLVSQLHVDLCYYTMRSMAAIIKSRFIPLIRYLIEPVAVIPRRSFSKPRSTSIGYIDLYTVTLTDVCRPSA